ncbi:MAG: hypothetical protein Q7S01_03260 [bacterium]|nr:hypothetical protein [bacterium]
MRKVLAILNTVLSIVIVGLAVFGLAFELMQIEDMWGYNVTAKHGLAVILGIGMLFMGIVSAVGTWKWALAREALAPLKLKWKIFAFGNLAILAVLILTADF